MKKFFILFLFFLVSCSLDSAKNAKQICDEINVWDKFSDLQEKFWQATLLTQTDLWEFWQSSSYYYWTLWQETCIIIEEKGEITAKQFTK